MHKHNSQIQQVIVTILCVLINKATTDRKWYKPANCGACQLDVIRPLLHI